MDRQLHGGPDCLPPPPHPGIPLPQRSEATPSHLPGECPAPAQEKALLRKVSGVSNLTLGLISVIMVFGSWQIR